MATPIRHIRERIFEISSQSHFGRLIGVDQSHICRLENGRAAITYNVQLKIIDAADALGIDLDANLFFYVPDDAAAAAREAAAE